MPLSRRSFLGASGSSFLALSAPSVKGQPAYPSAGPIRLLVPFAPGGSIDILSRIIVEGLSKQLGQTVIADNRPGGGGNIAMAAAARAAPDGYTILLTSSVIVVNPLLHKTVPFDPSKDFVPIALLATSPNIMVTKPNFAKSMSEFIASAKFQKGKLNYASSGIGTTGHFAAELLKLRAGIDLTHVPYASGAQIAQSLMSDSTQLGSTALPAGEPFIHAGTLSGIGITSAKRWPTILGCADIDRAGLS